MALHFRPRDGINVFWDYRHKLCDLLDYYQRTLLRFSRKAYQKEIISWHARREIKLKLGFSGAVVLLNSIMKMVERKPDRINVVFGIMMKLRRLKNITEDMRKEVWRIEERRRQIGKHFALVRMYVYLTILGYLNETIYWLLELHTRHFHIRRMHNNDY